MITTLLSWKESISLFKIDYSGKINVMKESWRTPQFRLWLAIVGATTLVLGAAYAMVQQSTRLAADDLPLATAQSIKYQLDNGADPNDIVPSIKTDLKNDASVFVTVTDNSRHVLASSATLNGFHQRTWQRPNNLGHRWNTLSYHSYKLRQQP
jgi:hypothetical protein